MPDDSRKALAYGIGGSVILVIVWGVVVARAPAGGLIKPVGEALITLAVLALCGLGCLVISIRQLLKAEYRRLAIWSLVCGTLPFITLALIFWYIGAVKGLTFA